MASESTLSGKTALVTGAARRIGKAIALGLAAQGVRVVIHYHTSKPEAEELAHQCAKVAGDAWAIQADLNNTDTYGQLYQSSVECAGPIDILINNASIFPEDTLGDVTLEGLEENVRVNAFSPLALSRIVVENGSQGSIVNLLDARMNDYDKTHVAYNLSKRMLLALTRMMAVDFAPSWRVNAVAPGLILAPEGKDIDYLARLAHTNPLQTHGNEHDVTEAVEFLLKSHFITGQIIYVDGGRHMNGEFYA